MTIKDWVEVAQSLLEVVISWQSAVLFLILYSRRQIVFLIDSGAKALQRVNKLKFSETEIHLERFDEIKVIPTEEK